MATLTAIITVLTALAPLFNTLLQYWMTQKTNTLAAASGANASLAGVATKRLTDVKASNTSLAAAMASAPGSAGSSVLTFGTDN